MTDYLPFRKTQAEGLLFFLFMKPCSWWKQSEFLWSLGDTAGRASKHFELITYITEAIHLYIFSGTFKTVPLI